MDKQQEIILRDITVTGSTSGGVTTGYQIQTKQKDDGISTVEEQSIPDPFDDEGIEYPKSKLKCWSVVFGSFLGLLAVWGTSDATGVIQTYILENQLSDTPTTTVSWVFSIFSCLEMICTIFSGTYFDRNGTRVPILVGSILFIISFLTTAVCTKAYQFILAFGVCGGAAAGILMSPLIGAVSHYFPKRTRSTALAVAGNGGCVGGFLFPMMLRKSYKTMGFAWSMRCMALVCAICLTVSFFLVRERKLVERKELSRKETAKLYLTSSFDLKALFTDKRYFYNAIGCLFLENNVNIGPVYYSFICVKSGFSQSDAYLFFTILNVFAIIGRCLAGIVADRYFGPYNVLIFLQIASAAINLVIWLPFTSSRDAMWTYTVLFGLSYGGIMSLVPSCCSQIVRPETFGARYATQYAITGFAILGLMPASSAILGDGLSDTRKSAFIAFVSILGLISAACYFETRYLSIGWKLRKF